MNWSRLRTAGLSFLYCAHPPLSVNSLCSVFCFSFLTPPQSLCLSSVLLFVCFLWGAEANTTVFLYINSCTLNTIQLLTKTDPPGFCLFFLDSFPLKQSFCLLCFFCSFLRPFCLCVALLRTSSLADVLTGTANQTFLLFHPCPGVSVAVHEPLHPAPDLSVTSWIKSCDLFHWVASELLLSTTPK